MSLGVISSGVSEIVEWKIPDFFSLGEDYTNSSCFLLDGCIWYLRVYPKGYKIDGWLSVYLRKDDAETAVKTMTFSFGIKTKVGILEEKCRLTNQIFKEGALCRGQYMFIKREDLQLRQCDLLPSGTLTITCRLEREVLTSEKVAPKLEEMDSRRTTLVELETLSSDFKDLRNSERNCDFMINVQGKEFRSHRSILSARSSVFRAMLEHDTAEAKSGILTIPDCDPETFGEFLNFLYTGKLEEMTYHAAYHLYATADKYDMQQLKSFCTVYMGQNLTTENICDVVVLADQHDNDKLMSSAQDFFSKNFYRIFLTSEWKAMLKNNLCLADRLLSEMSSAALKKS